MKYSTFLALLFLATQPAWGSGFQLRYQGAESMGTAFASAGSYGDSISNAYYNPGLFLSHRSKKAAALELMALHPTQAQFNSDSGSQTTKMITPVQAFQALCFLVTKSTTKPLLL